MPHAICSIIRFFIQMKTGQVQVLCRPSGVSRICESLCGVYRLQDEIYTCKHFSLAVVLFLHPTVSTENSDLYSLVHENFMISPSSTSGSIVVPPPNAQTGSPHSPPDPRLCAPISGGDGRRADRLSCVIAIRISLCPSSGRRQKRRISPRRISALQMISGSWDPGFCASP